MKSDIEREYLTEAIFAQERASLMEEEYYLFREPAKVTAKITYKTIKNNEVRSNTSPFPRVSEESVQSGHDLPFDTPRTKL
jgi:hypothetical protein